MSFAEGIGDDVLDAECLDILAHLEDVDLVESTSSSVYETIKASVP